MMTSTLILLTLCSTLLFLLAMAWMEIVACHRLNNLLEDKQASMLTTNPWKSQFLLMIKSGQEIPPAPAITMTTILYGALILEEAAETLIGLAKGIDEVSNGNVRLVSVASQYLKQARVMSLASVSIRHQLKECGGANLALTLSREVANEILDGCTDLHVVTAGLSIACGLPGQAGHDEVARSNMSKVNPVTNMIDKDASGKWIKGPEFFKPDLDALLAPFYDVGR
jgi:predicted HAD superfamily Cof-like phosphohydrolase